MGDHAKVAVVSGGMGRAEEVGRGFGSHLVSSPQIFSEFLSMG